MAKPERYAEVIARIAGAAPESKYIRAYHASPYNFDKFDFSKMGTGEGQQAFGPGGYFAQSPAVMEEYYKAFKRFRPNTSGKWSARTVSDAQDQLRGAGGDAELAARQLQALLPSVVDDLSLRPQVEDAIAYLQSKQAPKVTRYEVQINHPEESLLDYDAPMSRQNKNVQSVVGEDDLYAAAADGGIIGPDFDASGPIGPILSGHSAAGGRQAAIELFGRLQQSGVPGMRYLDGFSRLGAPRPMKTHNYVMFPGTEDQIRILRKYAVPGAIGAGAAGGMQGEQ